MREIKFRAWNEARREMSDNVQDSPFFGEILNSTDNEVMQFTGLKDKNGKEIYEGDIVKYEFSHPLHVVWLDAGWGVRWQDIGNTEEQFINTEDEEFQYIEIIGNIYENPELLKESV